MFHSHRCICSSQQMHDVDTAVETQRRGLGVNRPRWSCWKVETPLFQHTQLPVVCPGFCPYLSPRIGCSRRQHPVLERTLIPAISHSRWGPGTPCHVALNIISGENTERGGSEAGLPSWQWQGLWNRVLGAGRQGPRERLSALHGVGADQETDLICKADRCS